MLKKAQKIAVFVMIALVGLELTALMSLVYFTRIPFYFLIFAVMIRLVSFFLLGGVALFLILTMLGIKPDFTIEWWHQHMRDLARFFGTSLVSAALTIVACVLMGVGIVFLLKKIYTGTALGTIVETIRVWVAQQFY